MHRSPPRSGGVTRIPPSLASCLLAVICWPAVSAGGLDVPQPVGPYFNDVFPVSAPGSATGWTTENAFPNLSFVDPMWLAEIPGTSGLLVVGKSGTIWRFENDPAVTQAEVVEVLDWTAKTEFSEDQGFYRLCFHPGFNVPGSPGENQVFVTYSARAVEGVNDDDRTYWRLSRFTWLPESGTIDPASESVLINQYDPHRWHNGGGIFFDQNPGEGYLHVIAGDASEWVDVNNNTQRINQGLVSGLFRIDVDYQPGSARSHAIRRQPVEDPAWNKPPEWPASSTQGYGIPNDNPWLDPAGGVLEEFFALGFRSPHTMHFDPPTGDIYVGDVGQGTREELSRIRKGDNAQWSYQEGAVAGPRAKPGVLIGSDQPPLHDYGRDQGDSIIGGMRYRGTKWDALLGGKVIFGDHVRGKVWTATLDSGGGAPVVEEIVAGLPTGNKAGLANFCGDSAGEVYLMCLNGTNQAGGTIRKLAAAGVSIEPPPLLSQTGVFTDLATLATAPGVIPYDVANPLWSDGAAKKRWIILSNDGAHDSHHEDIVFSEEGNWLFPAGTVLVKHFEIGTDENNPAAVKRLETRFLVCTEGGGKYGVTYKWNEAGSDASLLSGGLLESYDVALAGGGTETRNWTYPSRADCLLCHTAAAGQALGVRTHSLNRDFHYPLTGRTANQLETFNDLGMFDRTLTATELANFIEARAIDDETAPIEHRVRSYLDSNCSHCHQPGATVGFFDARLGTPLNVQGLINGVIQGHFVLGPDGRYLKPGDPDLSALHVRMANVGNGVAMPPIAKNVVDQQAVDLLQEYLESLTEPEFEVTPSPQARYVMLTSYTDWPGYEFTAVGEFSVLDGNGSPIPVSEQSIEFVTSEELDEAFYPAERIIDGNPSTFWHTRWSGVNPPGMPHVIGIDLGSVRPVGGYIYTPRQSFAGAPPTDRNGRIKDYDVHYGNDTLNWTQMDSGTWPDNWDVQRFDGHVGIRQARCQIAGPVAPVQGPFDVTIVFDMDVSDFDAGDIQVDGGAVSGLRGKGYYYVARIKPADAAVSVGVAANVANLDGMGNRASTVLDFVYEDLTPPVPVFSDMPERITGPFQMWLIFDEAVTGLDASDFTLGNAVLDSIGIDGTAFLLSFTPVAAGPVKVELNAGAVSDMAGHPMGEGTSATGVYFPGILARNAADFSYLGGGMQLVDDAAAPGGKYVALPDGAFPANATLPVTTQHRAEYGFVVPQAGQWLLRGMIRPPNSAGDSFWIEIDGNQAAGTVYQWDVSPTGSAYVWDHLNNSLAVDPVVLDLTAGAHTVTVYGREDGTRLGRLELESVRPLAELTGPMGIVSGPFQASLVFSEDVTGLDAGDFSVTGAEVAAVEGSGASYTVTLVPGGPAITVSLPENATIDAGGAGNFGSNAIEVVARSAYLLWAMGHGVDGTLSGQLADDDGDGLETLIEFAFNLDPTRSDRRVYQPEQVPGSGLPRMIVSPGPGLSLQYLRRKDGGLTYTPQFGSSPGEFADATGFPSVESIDATWERVTIADPAGPGTARRFGRVVVTMSTP